MKLLSSNLLRTAGRAGGPHPRAGAGFCQRILAAWMLTAALSGPAATPPAVAGPQQYVPAGHQASVFRYMLKLNGLVLCFVNADLATSSSSSLPSSLSAYHFAVTRVSEGA